MADKMFTDLVQEDLTPEQRTFLEETALTDFENIFLTGCAGSGKTVLAAMTAKEFARQHKPVKFLTYTKFLKKYVKDHFERRSADITTSIDHYHSWIRESDIDEDSQVSLAIIDECQDFDESMVYNTISRSKSQIWLGDINQQIYGRTFDSNGYSILNTMDFSKRHHLSTNFRNSISIAMMVKCFITFNEEHDKDYENLDEKIKNFIYPITKNPAQSTTNKNQPNTIIHAKDAKSEYDAIAEKIRHIQSTEKGYKQIVVTAAHHDHLDDIGDELTNRGIDYERYYTLKSNEAEPDIDFTNPNLVLLCPIHTMKGFECDYLIVPNTESKILNFERFFSGKETQFGGEYKLNQDEKDRLTLNLLFMLFSRAKKRIICSYVNEGDSIVYKYIKEVAFDKNTKKYFQFQTSDEVLSSTGGDNYELSEEEVRENIKEVQSGIHWPFADDEPLEDEPVEQTELDIDDDEEDDLPF